MRSIRALASIAKRLHGEAGGPPIPCLYFVTDPERTPDPVSVAERLPAGTAVIYRHFGAPDRYAQARRLARLCQRRALHLLIAADPALAARTGAAGVHWPERRLPANAAMPGRLVTAAAHGWDGLARASASGASAVLLGPVFSTRSASGNPPLGLFRASQLAQAARPPVIALGGIGNTSARQLIGRGFAGLAAVDAFVMD